MYSCVGTILSSLKEPVKRHGAYVFQYEDLVRQLEQENRGLGEIKDRIERLVDTATRNARCIEPGVSRWLGEVEQTERDIAIFLRQQENREQMARDFANFLRQQENGEQMERDIANILRQKENGEQMERDIANFLRQQENGEQMERDFANFLCQQENKEQMERDIANFLRQQQNGEQMERDFANFRRQQQNGESFRCFPGCMCPNLMWRCKRGMEADKMKSEVCDLIRRGDLLQTSPVAREEPFRSDLHFDSPPYYTTFQSRDSIVDEIKNALKDSGVDMIGVHGPGGAGKTTMVKEVAKETKKRGIFDEIVIAVVSKEPNTSKLQEELASRLDLKCEQRSELGRPEELRKALLNALLNGKRRILVILDDLWQVLDLNAIGIPISGLGNRGCKILLTSRDEEVFRRMEVRSCVSISCVRIGYLEEQETLKLFTKVTGDFGVDELTARKVSERCGGLPIAIVAVGAALKGKEEAEWKNALHQLENCPLKYIEGSKPVGYTPLKWSYDYLEEEDAKSCFLLCCLFPEDAEISIDDLVRYSFALRFLRKVATLKDARNRVQTMVNMLKRSCLLLNGENKNFVKMHDVIRDLAISMTEEKQMAHGGGHDWAGQQQFIVDHDIKEWPKNDAWEHHTAISLRINKDDISFPRGVLHCPLMHTLVFKAHDYNCGHRIIPNDFFQGMKEARVLDFKNMFYEVPSSVLELNHLQMLRLNNCYFLEDLSTIRNLTNHIEILSFEGSSIKELPQEIGKLTRLRSLDLRKVFLQVIPKGVISNLIYLEELYVTQSYRNWDTTTNGGMGYASIGELKSLNKLTILHVGILTKSYRIMMQECRHLFEKLINFVILINIHTFVGNEFQNVLEIVNIDGTHDEFCLLMDRVEKLSLCNIQGLRYLRGNPQLQFTSSGGGSFCKLIDLYISECHSMKYLFPPSCAKAFQQLKTLSVHNCRIMEQIIGGVGDHCNENEVVTEEAIIFSRLERIKLSRLPQFRSFCPKMEKTAIEENLSNWTTATESIFNEKVIFPKIENVRLKDLKSSREIQLWDFLATTQEYLHTVSISIFGCQVSTKVSSHHQKRSFRMIVDKLFLENCQGFKHVIDLNGTISIGEEQFVDVKSLQLHDLPELVLLWNKNFHEIGSLRNLKYLIIKNCSQLKSLFTHWMATTLHHLEGLSVTFCEMMEEIIIIEENNINFARKEKATRHIEFPKLQRLFLDDLPNLKNFCNDERGSFSFSSLRMIVVEKCPKMKTFASGQICLPPRMMTQEAGYKDVEITDLNAFFESRNEDNNYMIEINIWGEMTFDEGLGSY